MSRKWFERHGMALVLAMFVALGVLYSVTVPVLEKPDEAYHFFFFQHLLEEKKLPMMGTAGENLWEQEGSQPPLYYLLAALSTSWVDSSDARDLYWVNPQRNLGDPGDPGNKNFIVHTEREAWPYRGATLAIHLCRWLSLFFGAGTVAVTYAIARLVFPGRPLMALGAAAVTAFIPQFIFVSSSVSNDSLIAFLCALGLWQLLLMVSKPMPPPFRAYIWLGCTVGLAALTKLSGLALLGLTVGALAWLIWRRPSLRRSYVIGGLAVTALVALIAGWWYLRNLRLYGDLSGIGEHLAIMGGRRELPPLTLESVRSELFGLRASFWGLFGWFSILMPAWTYLLLDLLTALGGLGLVAWWVRTGAEHRRRMGLLLLWLVVVAASLVRWTLLTHASQGRLLFPALPAFACGLAAGWDALIPTRGRLARWRGALLLASTTWLLVLSVAAPSQVIAPAYQLPELIESDQLPADLQLHRRRVGRVHPAVWLPNGPRPP